MTSSRLLITCPHGGPLRAQGILGTVGKISAPFELLYKNQRGKS